MPNIKDIIEIFGTVTKAYNNGDCIGIVNHYKVGVEQIDNGYLLTIYVNGDIKKFSPNLDGIRNMLEGLK
jgi:hypothetical protein